jgi:ferric-dicitrate binding protein FerR (iron transport regulator)
MAWKTKLMIFIDKPLDEVIGILNQVYGANLTLASEDLSNCRLTATFENQSLPAVLQVITSTLGLEIQSTPKQTVLSGEGCN